jgi:hypothetical protein
MKGRKPFLRKINYFFGQHLAFSLEGMASQCPGLAVALGDTPANSCDMNL